MGKSKVTLVYNYAQRVSFVRKDLKILASYSDLKEYEFDIRKKWKIPFLTIKQFGYFSFQFLKGKIVVVSRSSGAHTYVPSLFSKWFPSRFNLLIIIGGNEANSLPSINYGLMNTGFVGLLNGLSLKNATHILPVSRHLIKSDYTFDDSFPSLQGVHAFYPKVKTPFTEIFNGFDPAQFSLNNSERRKNSFVTIASGLESERRRIIKGIDSIVMMAKEFPAFHFTIIGSNGIGETPPKNLELIPFVENDKMVDFLNNFEFYLQLSVSEGFPNALCEAMLCGCIPIVSNVGIMPEIVGETGFVVLKKDKENLLKVFNSLEIEGSKTPGMTRQRVIDNYSLDIRESKLKSIIDQHIDALSN